MDSRLDGEAVDRQPVTKVRGIRVQSHAHRRVYMHPSGMLDVTTRAHETKKPFQRNSMQ